MLSSLANPILPIFAVLAVGFGMYRLKVFDVEAARAINKFVFYIATPALVFTIISSAPLSAFDGRALSIYFLAQLIIYLAVFLITHFVFGVEKKLSVLLGMTSTFVNHVFFVLPISERIYGELAAQPIAGIVLIDALVMFCGTVLIMDLMHSERPSPLKVIGLLARNPFLIASTLGMASWVVKPIIPEGFYTFATFAGASAAPASLFSLGIILASNPLRPIGIETWTVIVAKIILHPILVLSFSAYAALTPNWDNIILLVAAGPCGAMPFVIALQYGVKADVIAKAILISTFLSLASLSFLTSY